MATPLDQMMQLAHKQVGTHEVPVGSNKQKYGAWYVTQVHNASYNGCSWCAEFVTWVFAHSIGLTPLKSQVWAYVPFMVNRAKADGKFVAAGNLRRGDIIFFDWNHDGLADHVGIVQFALGGGRYQTIEGNTSSGPGGSQSNGDGVYTRVRKDGVFGGWRVTYPAAAKAKSTLKVNKNFAARAKAHPLPKLDATGLMGPLTHKWIQQSVGRPTTGKLNKRDRMAVQRRVGVQDDGDWGPVTIKALQRRILHVKVTGRLDKATIKRWQTCLIHKKF